MKNWVFPLLLLTPVLVRAQVQPPALAGVLDAQGRLHRLEGLPGALVLADACAEGVLSAASSATTLLWKTESAVAALDGRDWPAPPGPALFAFDAQGQPVAAWFSEPRELRVFQGEELILKPYYLDGDVQGLAAPVAGRLVVLVQVILKPFRVVSDLPLHDADASAVLLPDGTLFKPDNGDGYVWQPAAPGYLLGASADGAFRLLRLRDRSVYTVPTPGGQDSGRRDPGGQEQ